MTTAYANLSENQLAHQWNVWYKTRGNTFLNRLLIQCLMWPNNFIVSVGCDQRRKWSREGITEKINAPDLSVSMENISLCPGSLCAPVLFCIPSLFILKDKNIPFPSCVYKRTSSVAKIVLLERVVIIRFICFFYVYECWFVCMYEHMWVQGPQRSEEGMGSPWT